MLEADRHASIRADDQVRADRGSSHEPRSTGPRRRPDARRRPDRPDTTAPRPTQGTRPSASAEHVPEREAPGRSRARHRRPASARRVRGHAVDAREVDEQRHERRPPSARRARGSPPDSRRSRDSPRAGAAGGCAPAPRTRGGDRRVSTDRPSNGLTPATTAWRARIAPNSIGNASSDRANSSLAITSGVARPCRAHAGHAPRARVEIRRSPDRRTTPASARARPSPRVVVAGVHAKDDHRPQPVGHDRPEVAGEAFGHPSDVGCHA